jgi:hypothetical protein
MKSKAIILIVLSISFFSCKKDEIDVYLRLNPDFADELRKSPQTIIIGESSLQLYAYAWRDFMPGNPDHSLIVISRLYDLDNIPLPTDITLKKQFVINEYTIWIGEYSNIYSNELGIEGGVWNGPEWEIGTVVDVVCEFKIRNKIYRILAKDIPVEATS